MTATDDLVEALSPVVKAFRELDIPHFVGGSIASSFHGATRSTMDVDIVCRLAETQVDDFVSRFSEDYYISPTAVSDAAQRKTCFNLIHLATSFKVDVFVSRERPFDEEAMARAELQTLGGGPTVEVPVATAEDIIISKLECYRLTDETSDRQWDDVSRLMELLLDDVDLDYLRRSAESVGVADLVGKLLSND